MRTIHLAILPLFFLTLYYSACAQVSKEVRFSSSQADLAGTLTLPDTLLDHPVLVLISGSGGQTRDSEIMGMKIFEKLSDQLVAAGYAVLRFDDRGVGESSGKALEESTLEDLAEDVQAAVAFLLKEKHIDPDQIGLLGHSEGGAVAPMVATRSKEVAFIILLAGYGVKGSELSTAQQEQILKSSGMPQSYIEKAKSVNYRMYEMAADREMPEDRMREEIKDLLLELVEGMPPAMKASISDPEAFAEMQADPMLRQLRAPWTAYFFGYDPAPTLKRVECPVLLIFGELDAQVTAEQNREVMEKALQSGGNSRFQTAIIPRANHLFQLANTGSVAEYASLEKAFAPELLPTLTNWLMQVAPPAKK